MPTLKADIKGFPLAPRSWRSWRKHGTRPGLIEVWDDKSKQPGRFGVAIRGHRVKFVPWQAFRVRFDRCAECGRRMNRAARFSYPSTDKVWHDECMSLRHYRSNELITLEALDRLFQAWSIDDAEALKSLVENPFEGRDQFLLWYRTWESVEWYRGLANDDRWRAPNQPPNFWRQNA